MHSCILVKDDRVQVANLEEGSSLFPIHFTGSYLLDLAALGMEDGFLGMSFGKRGTVDKPNCRAEISCVVVIPEEDWASHGITTDW